MGRNGGHETGYSINWSRGNSDGTRQGLEQGVAKNVPANPVELPHDQSCSEYFDPEGTGLESLDQEIAMLRAQADVLKAQFQTVNTRVSELQGGKVSAVADIEMPGRISNDTMGGRNVAIVAGENCVNCGICVSVCPVEAITMCEITVIDSQKCTGCGACVDECPNSAISLVELEKMEQY
jgi:ferredoxin